MLRILFVLFLTMTATADAIVIRHDRDDNEYRQLAAEYPMVCRVGPGMGTLIDSLWVMTAAHVAHALPRGAAIHFGERAVSVKHVAIHPDFALPDKHRDLALVQLSEPVLDLTPARLYRGGSEKGQRVTFVGDGRTGTGRSGPVPGDRVLRSAHNTVDSARAGWLVFIFDEPPAGDELEGISGPGDSGGPAILEQADTLYLVGVSAYNDGNPPCTYGTREYYCRISDAIDWIDGIMKGDIPVEKSPRLMRYGRDSAGNATVVREKISKVEVSKSADAILYQVLFDLVQSIEQNSPEQYLSLFTLDHVQQRKQAGDPLIGMHQFMIEACRIRGPIGGFHRPAPEAVKITDSKYPMRPVVFHFEDGMPGYFGIALDDLGKIDHLSVFVQESICPKGKACTHMHKLNDLMPQGIE